MKKLITILFLFLLTSFSGPSHVTAIAVSSPVAGTASTSNATSYAMTPFTPSATSLLVVFVYATGTVAATPTVSGGSLTWTLEASAINLSSSGNSIYCFWAKVGGSPVSTTITFDCTADAATGTVLSVIQFTGYNSTITDPIRQAKMPSAATTSTNANITFSSVLNTNNGYAVGWVGGFSTAPQSTPPTGFTEADDLAFNTPAGNMSTAFEAGGQTTSGAFTFTNTSTTWGAFGVEVYASGQPSSTISNFFF